MLKKEEGLTLEMAAELYFYDKCEENLNTLVSAGSGLIYHFIRLYGLQQFCEDLFQAGSEGLMKAVARYDPQNGASFITYAGSLIIGEIRHYMRKEAAYYRPKIVEKLRERINDAIEAGFVSTGQAPRPGEVAKSLNLREDGVAEVIRMGLVPLDEVDLSKIASAKPESFKLTVEDRIMLVQALDKLTHIQRKVIYLLFFRELTQAQAAEKLDTNQRKVSRILHSGLRELKKNII